MRAILDKFFGVIGGLNFTQRIAVGTLVMASIFAFGFFFNHSREDYDVMFSGLEETDAAAVVRNLKEQGVPFRLAEGGTTVLVPAKRKEELRLNAFDEDLIKSNKTVGFGALDSLPFGLTDWQEKKYDQKIISDEVVTTLERIKGIKKARVILAQPEESLYTAEKDPPTASVLLITEPGFRLKPEQVRTIKGLVARSVPGLEEDHVAVADSLGNTLSDDSNLSNNPGSGGERDTMRLNFEHEKSKDIVEMLNALVGPSNAVVKVSVKMNFDKAESHIKRFIPSGGDEQNPIGIPVSVQSAGESLVGQTNPKGTQGEPGANSNVPTYTTEEAAAGGGQKTNDYKKNNVITNYEISHEEQTVVHAPGTVEKMSIAVVVNKVLTSTEKDKLTNLVASAAGVDYSRGDTITVDGLQFSPDLQQKQEQSLDILKQSNQKEMIVSLTQIAGIFILSMIAMFLFYSLLKRPAEGELMADEEPYVELPPEEDEPEPLLPTTAIPILEAKLDPEIEMMREAIHNMVKKDPTEAARVLVTYMKEM